MQCDRLEVNRISWTYNGCSCKALHRAENEGCRQPRGDHRVIHVRHFPVTCGKRRWVGRWRTSIWQNKIWQNNATLLDTAAMAGFRERRAHCGLRDGILLLGAAVCRWLSLRMLPRLGPSVRFFPLRTTPFRAAVYGWLLPRRDHVARHTVDFLVLQGAIGPTCTNFARHTPHTSRADYSVSWSRGGSVTSAQAITCPVGTISSGARLEHTNTKKTRLRDEIPDTRDATFSQRSS